MPYLGWTVASGPPYSETLAEQGDKMKSQVSSGGGKYIGREPCRNRGFRGEAHCSSFCFFFFLLTSSLTVGNP